MFAKLDSQQDELKKTQANNFLKYAHTSNIAVFPDYGLMERASKPGEISRDLKEFTNFKDALWQKADRDKASSVRITLDEPLEARLYPFYAYLLKIQLILFSRTPSCNSTKSNIQDLYNFTNRIGIYLTLPWQLALAIFGGDTKLKKFISLKSKEESIESALWRAAWDLSYLQLIQQYNGTRRKGTIFPKYLLVTGDHACATIGELVKNVGVLDKENFIYNVIMMNANFPHLEHISDFLTDIFSQMEQDIQKRVEARKLTSRSRREDEHQIIISKAKSLILELEEQLRKC